MDRGAVLISRYFEVYGTCEK